MRPRCWSSRRAPSKCKDVHEVPVPLTRSQMGWGLRAAALWHGTDGKSMRASPKP